MSRRSKITLKKVFSVILSLTLFLQTAFAADLDFSEKLSDVPAQMEQEVSDNISLLQESSEMSKILCEDETKREHNTKYFLCEDGSMVASIYDDSVHYMDNGKWEDIDNTLVEAKTKNGQPVYINKANDMRVELPKALNASPITVQNGDYKISWMVDSGVASAAKIVQPLSESARKSSLETKLKKANGEQERTKVLNGEKTLAENQKSSVTYTNAVAEADFQYDVLANKLKESIILQKLPKEKSYSFQISADGLHAEIAKDNSVIFYVKNPEEPAFIIEAPYMFDTLYETSESILVSLEKTKAGYQYTITPDREWLSDRNRSWPVTIDPVITTPRQEKDKLSSTFVSEGQPGVAFGTKNLDFRHVGYKTATNFRERRTYLKIKTLPDEITASCRVTSAFLNMTYIPFDKDGILHDPGTNLQVNLYKVNGSWDQNTLAWSMQPACEAVPADFVYPRPFNSSTEAPWQGDEFDITAIMQDWISNRDTNHGVRLSIGNKTGSTNHYAAYVSHQSEYKGCYPFAVISYRDTKGLEDYWTYTSEAGGRGVVASVNNFNGNLTVTVPVEGVGGSRMPMNLSLVYNEFQYDTLNSFDDLMNLGNGWRTNYHARVVVESRQALKELGYYYYMEDEDGTIHHFHKENNIHKDEDGLGYTITDAGQGVTERFTITDKDGNRMVFNDRGYLYRIYDVHSSDYIQINIDHGTTGNRRQRITGIKDGAGRTYTFSYSSERLVGIYAPDGRQLLTLNYTGDRYLTSIKYPDNQYTYFDYSNTTTPGYSMRSVVSPGNNRIGFDQRETKKGDMNYDASYINRSHSQKSLRMHALITRCPVGSSIGGEERTESRVFSYKHNATTVTSLITGDITKYQFNSFGQTTCVIDGRTGKAQYYEQGKPRDGKTAGSENKVTTASRVQTGINNRLKNSGFTQDLSNYIPHVSSTAPNGTVTYDSTKGFMTKGALRLSKPAGNHVMISQPLPAKSGMHTFSAYVSTMGATLSAGEGLYIRLEVYNTNGSGVFSSYVSQPLYKTENNEWQRVTVSGNIPAGHPFGVSVILGSSNGTVYVDDLQLESGETANHCNLLENSDFTNGTNKWSFWTNGSSTVHTGGTDSNMPAGQAVSLNAKPTSSAEFSQNIAVNGKKGDIFNFGTWVKYNTPNAPSTPDISGAYKRVSAGNTKTQVLIRFVNGSNKYDVSVDVNSYINDWQYISLQAIANMDYTAIYIYFIHHHNIGSVYYASPFLYKEAFGTSYAYDKNGNIISTQDLSKNNAEFKYKDNQLLKETAPTGSYFSYHMDNNKNPLHSLSSEGQLYTFGHDAYGNMTSAKVSALKPSTSLVAGKTYLIENVFSGNFMDVTNVAKNQRIGYGHANRVFKLVATSHGGDVFALQNTSVTGSVTVAELTNGNTADKADLRCATYNTSLAQQRFKITANGDGTFKIRTSPNNYAKVVDGQPAGTDKDNVNTETGSPIQQMSDKGTDCQKWRFYEYTSDSALDNQGYMQTSATYGNNNNYLSSITDQRGNTINYSYDANKGRLNQVSDQKGTITGYTYDALGRTTQVSSGGSYVGYGYNSADQLSNIWHNNSQVKYSFIYDVFGRRTNVRVGNDSGSSYNNLASYTYNAKGQPDVMTYGTGQTVKTLYDSFDRVAGKQYNGVTATNIVYNADNQPGIVRDYVDNTKTVFQYDLSGRPVNIKTYNGSGSADDGTVKAQTNYKYDSKGRLDTTRLQYENGLFNYNTGYGYGTAGRENLIAGVRWNADSGWRMSYQYDNFGRRTGRLVANVNTTYAYHQELLMSGLRTNTLLKTLTNTNNTTGQIEKYSYTYDSVGNITGINKNDAIMESYQYDSLNQLVRHNSVTQNKTYTYTYDKGGNITSKVEHAYTTGTPGTAQNTVSYGYTSTVWKDLLTSYNGTAITYDQIGNPLSYRGMNMTWSKGRQLQSISGTKTAGFTYDADGARTSKTVGGVTHQYYYADGKMQHEAWGNERLSYMVDENGNYFGLRKTNAQNNGSTMYNFLFNAQGDVIGLVDNMGNFQASYTYDAWGKVLSVKDKNGNEITDPNHIANINPIRYRGYYYDTETGFYYLQSRYYDPTVGRFINADGLLSTGMGVLGHNMFAYCDNNPIARFDPTGHSWWSAISNFADGFVSSVNNAVVGTAKGIYNFLTTDPITNAKNIYNAVKSDPKSLLPFYGTFENIVYGIYDIATGKTDQGLYKIGSAVGTISVVAVTAGVTKGIGKGVGSIKNVSKSVSNPGVPFQPKGSFQIGVNPHTLQISRPLLPAKLNAARLRINANGGVYGQIEVSRAGIIWDGNHRVAIAREMGAAVDVVIR